MPTTKQILPGASLGVLGGGQLGRMFAIAAKQLGYRVVVYTPEQNSPASQVCDLTIVGDFEDATKLAEFADEVEVVTLEFENIPVSALNFLAERVPVRPNPNALHITQHRGREKTFLKEQSIPTVKFSPVQTMDDLVQAITITSIPAVLKTAGFGYDGKGQVRITQPDQLDSALAAMNGQPAILEQWIAFEGECSVIGARTPDGEFVAYGPVENRHVNHILDLTLSPATLEHLTPDVAIEAVNLTRRLMEALDITGLLCVEFFLTTEGQLLVNELAPRPHNSGHYTIDACVTSQFEQQVRAICNLPLGSTEQPRSAVMANLLGDHLQSPDWGAIFKMPDIKLHLYGKVDARSGRKMGHLTALGENALASVTEARQALKNALIRS